jgi:hypothetical protein
LLILGSRRRGSPDDCDEKLYSYDIPHKDSFQSDWTESHLEKSDRDEVLGLVGVRQGNLVEAVAGTLLLPQVLAVGMHEKTKEDGLA